MTDGSTPYAAARALRDAFQLAVSCVTADVVANQADGAGNKVTLASRLTSSSAGHLWLSLRHYFLAFADNSRERQHRWQARTTAYYYTLDDADGREVLAYHWHPVGRSPEKEPHLHLGAGAGTIRQELAEAHLATGPVMPVAMVTLILKHFGVRPRRADWAEILARVRQTLEMSKCRACVTQMTEAGRKGERVTDKERHKALQAQYKQAHPEAGVYRVVNTRTGKSLLGSSTNLASVRNRLAFAKSTNMPGALDHRLREDVRQFGLDAFSLEVLDVLDTKAEMTPAEIRRELSILEALWREKLDPALLY